MAEKKMPPWLKKTEKEMPKGGSKPKSKAKTTVQRSKKGC
jgi:hypothetical protein